MNKRTNLYLLILLLTLARPIYSEEVLSMNKDSCAESRHKILHRSNVSLLETTKLVYANQSQNSSSIHLLKGQ